MYRRLSFYSEVSSASRERMTVDGLTDRVCSASSVSMASYDRSFWRGPGVHCRRQAHYDKNVNSFSVRMAGLPRRYSSKISR